MFKLLLLIGIFVLVCDTTQVSRRPTEETSVTEPTEETDATSEYTEESSPETDATENETDASTETTQTIPTTRTTITPPILPPPPYPICCGKNEFYLGVGQAPYCDTVCSDIGKRCKIRYDKAEPCGCYCKLGHCRDSNNKCILMSDANLSCHFTNDVL